MVHSKPEYAESVKLLTFSQLKKLERMDAKKEREAKLIELAKVGIQSGSDIIGRGLEGTITGPVLLSLILIGAYGWGPTRTLYEQLAQGIAYGAAQGWKNSIAPTLSAVRAVARAVSPAAVTR